MDVDCCGGALSSLNFNATEEPRPIRAAIRGLNAGTCWLICLQKGRLGDVLIVWCVDAKGLGEHGMEAATRCRCMS